MLTTATAHDSDVNVISWSRREPFLLSGGDDGALKVWDLRQFKVSSLQLWEATVVVALGLLAGPGNKVHMRRRLSGGVGGMRGVTYFTQ